MTITHLKLRHYEKATKFEKISHLFWQSSCFYSVSSKQVEDFFQIFVAFIEKLSIIRSKKSFSQKLMQHINTKLNCVKVERQMQRGILYGN